MSTTSKAVANVNAGLDEAIDRAIAEQRIVGTVVLASYDSELIYHRAAGLADREAGTAMREDAIFRLSSLSKEHPLWRQATHRVSK
jgi:CubicO group peptidase (beta-lactamase class C family)